MNSNSQSLGEKIATFRKSQGLTQSDLAKKLNVSFQAVSKWETDAAEPDIRTLRELCQIFNVTFDELMGEDDNNIKSVQVENNGVSEEKHISSPTPIIINTSPMPNSNNANSTEQKILVGTCQNCGKAIYEGDKYQKINGKLFCEKCHDNILKAQKDKMLTIKNEQMFNIKKMNRLRNTGFIVGAIVFIVFLVFAILAFTNTTFKENEINLTVGLALLILGIGGFCITELLFIKRGGWFIDLVEDALFLNIKWPGIIFTLDIDGVVFAIVLKTIFSILSFIATVTLTIFALVAGSIISIVLLPFYLVSYQKEIKSLKNRIEN